MNDDKNTEKPASVDISKATENTTQTSKENEGAGGKSQTGANGGTETGKQDEGNAGDEGTHDGESKDDINPDTGQPYTTEEWRDKFRASSKGANELLEAKKTLESDIAKVRADSDKTLKEKDEEIARLRGLAEGKNPEGLSLHDLQKEFGKISSELALTKENTMLDTFLSGTKIAGADSFKETLRALARANPNTPVSQLWDSNLKAAAEASALAAKDRKTSKEKHASDSGQGASSREQGKETVHGTDLTLEEFNALPVAKRGEILAKAGVA